MKASNNVPATKKHNSSFNNSKYLSNHSPSPSQTFFKDSKKGQSLIGKKVLPPFGKKANKIYVSDLLRLRLIILSLETVKNRKLPLKNVSKTDYTICKRSSKG